MNKIGIATLLVLALVGGPASLAGAQTQGTEKPPGEGVMCGAGIFNYLAEAGRRCEYSTDPKGLQTIQRIAGKFDAYLLANGWSPSDLETFKSEQSKVGQPLAEVCDDGARAWYEATEASILKDGPKIEGEIDRLLSKPGRPTWGTCL